MNSELHIVSLVVHCSPQKLDAVLAKAQRLPQAEYYFNQGQYKFILLFEAASESALANQIDQIATWPGVLSAQLCYHHCEPIESLHKDIHYEPYTT